MARNHLYHGNANYSHREMQLFLASYIILEICEIFTVGKFPLNNTVRIVSHTTAASGKLDTDNHRRLLVYILEWL